MIYPLKSWSGFGYKHGDWTFYFTRHKGYDFIVHTGAPIYACISGMIDAGYDVGGGNFIYIYSDDGKIISRYFHLSSRAARRGQEIREGDLVGYSGNTGTLTTAPHLHWDLQIDKQFVDPIEYLEEFNKDIFKQLNMTHDELIKELKGIFVARDARLKFDPKSGAAWLCSRNRRYKIGTEPEGDLSYLADLMTSGLMTNEEQKYFVTKSRKDVL